jgi:hypothetical protein|tara:strand:+ start:1381 stop:1599 length:219 start_codon:yes stop_codon:yes gene_type:complete
MRTQPPESLDFSEIVDLVDGVKMVLHALNGNIFGSLDALGLEHLRESSFAFLGDQTILVHFLNVYKLFLLLI